MPSCQVYVAILNLLEFVHRKQVGPVPLNNMQTPLKSGHIDIRDAQYAEKNKN